MELGACALYTCTPRRAARAHPQARVRYEEMRRERAATVLQSNWRRFVAASDFERRRVAATKLQNAWRCAALGTGARLPRSH